MMNARHGIRFVTSSIFATALACAATGVPAQTIYTLVDAGGKITFTDRTESTPALQADAAPELEVARSPARISGISSRRAAAVVDVKEAARRLRQAQLSRKQGMQPLPGEQARALQGGAVNDRYWRRQEKLRLVVEQAQRRQQETVQPQLAAR